MSVYNVCMQAKFCKNIWMLENKGQLDSAHAKYFSLHSSSHVHLPFHRADSPHDSVVSSAQSADVHAQRLHASLFLLAYMNNLSVGKQRSTRYCAQAKHVNCALYEVKWKICKNILPMSTPAHRQFLRHKFCHQHSPLMSWIWYGRRQQHEWLECQIRAYALVFTHDQWTVLCLHTQLCARCSGTWKIYKCLLPIFVFHSGWLPCTP